MKHQTAALVAATAFATAPLAAEAAPTAEAAHPRQVPSTVSPVVPQPAPPAKPHTDSSAYRSTITYTFTPRHERNSAYGSVLVVQSSRALSPAEVHALDR